MKKLLVLVVSALIALFIRFLYSGTDYAPMDKACAELYKCLSKENFGDLDEEKVLCINVGIDYIPFELIEVFERLSGVRVIVDIFDSNEILEAKLLAGSTQYDVVFPTAWPHFSRQLSAKIYQKIDKTKVNYAIFDKDVLSKLARYDIDNQYALPYQFGISGIGINADIVNALAKDAPIDSYALVFDPIYAKKLSKYRISLYESPDELFPAVLAYLGIDPESEDERDIERAAEHLKKIRPYIAKFTAYGFEDLASENACAVLSNASGDIVKASMVNKKSNIKFVFPKEGASLWVDVAAIPRNAMHVKNAYAFFKFIFNPRVIAYVTNCTSRANAVTSSARFVNSELIKNENVYPTAEIKRKCYIEKPSSPKIEFLKTRLLTMIKSMS